MSGSALSSLPRDVTRSSPGGPTHSSNRLPIPRPVRPNRHSAPPAAGPAQGGGPGCTRGAPAGAPPPSPIRRLPPPRALALPVTESYPIRLGGTPKPYRTAGEGSRVDPRRGGSARYPAWRCYGPQVTARGGAVRRAYWRRPPPRAGLVRSPCSGERDGRSLGAGLDRQVAPWGTLPGQAGMPVLPVGCRWHSCRLPGQAGMPVLPVGRMSPPARAGLVRPPYSVIRTFRGSCAPKVLPCDTESG